MGLRVCEYRPPDSGGGQAGPETVLLRRSAVVEFASEIAFPRPLFFGSGRRPWPRLSQRGFGATASVPSLVNALGRRLEVGAAWPPPESGDIPLAEPEDSAWI